MKLKEIQIMPISNPSGLPTNIYQHYFMDIESIRMERDSRVVKIIKFGQTRQVLQKYIPIAVETLENLQAIRDLKELTQEFIEMAEHSIRPISCFGRRRTNCFCCFRSLFGEPEQMGNVLAETFQGEHRWINHTKPGRTIIDAMFFPASSEVVDDKNASLHYKQQPTFILCNPNAMFYQHMINYPHAFYLRFFLQKGINVCIWNYRGYGRSHMRRCNWLTGTPTPENIREDAECMLRYLQEEMGIKGKFGVYGRSMGGVATCHLASLVDMVIVDRTFASLEKVIDKKFFGVAAESVYSISALGWRSSNVEGYLRNADDIRRDQIAISLRSGHNRVCDSKDIETGPQERNCYKVISGDVQDEMIELQASLAMGVAIKVAQDYAEETNYKG